MASPSGLELLAVQGLQTAEQMQLLDIVDSLRAQGLSEFTALPQLIVCGDQSSGKSSVLEAISGVPFPRQDNLCTRFATEVILRRAANDGISVGIVPAKGKTKEDQGRLLRFGAKLATREDFPVLFEKAKEAMGLSDSGMAFSKDILRVEIRGPTQPQLTLVDLPGLIHSETNSQTTQDVELVTKLVAEYMANPRSIILAVVSAKNDVGNQIVLRRAREVDPQGMRTLGIITKPDTLPMDSSSEKAFLSLARNEDVKFQLGWHVVKNIDSGAKDSKSEKRDELETAYFKSSNFKSLPSHSVGITALRARLSKILFNQIRVELPILVEDIQRQVAVNEAQLAKIGSSRATGHEQRVFLSELSQAFQIICRDAVRGDYEHAFFQDDKNCEKRLCATIMNMHFAFAEELRTDGARWKITDEAVDENCRTRKEAIEEACMLLKTSRGREVPDRSDPNRLACQLTMSMAASRTSQSSSRGHTLPRIQQSMGRPCAPAHQERVGCDQPVP
jgi:GTPase SAR1 family protein